MFKILAVIVFLASAVAHADAIPKPKPVQTASEQEMNKALIRRFYEEVWNRGNLAVADVVFAKDYVRHDPSGGGPPTPGPEGQRQIAAGIRKAFPDLVMTVDFVVAERDMVVARWTIKGTHKGDMPLAKASGKPVTFSGVNAYRFVKGQVVELWNHRDDLSLMIQLGVVKPPLPPKQP